MRVKICGLTRLEDALAVRQAGADAVGLMFVPESPRHIDLELAAELAEAVGPLVVTVGVFRDAPLERVLAVATRLRLGAVQIHGDADSSYLEAVRAVAQVIRAVSFVPGLGRAELEALPADAVMLDGVRSGSGRAFDWERAAHLTGLPGLILAGGLDPGNVADGIRAMRPYGVDVSSGVERIVGVKDAGRISEFVRAARAAPANPVG